MRLHPHNVVALNQAGNVCSKCGIARGTFYFIGSELVCEWCQMKTDPPILKLFYTSYNVLYSKKGNESLWHPPVEDLERCGWFLRKIRRFEEAKESVFIGEYTFEYYGSFECKLVSDYVIWPMKIVKCPSQRCNINVLRKGEYYDNRGGV